jgi:hypothetical protein
MVTRHPVPAERTTVWIINRPRNIEADLISTVVPPVESWPMALTTTMSREKSTAAAGGRDDAVNMIAQSCCQDRRSRITQSPPLTTPLDSKSDFSGSDASLWIGTGTGASTAVVCTAAQAPSNSTPKSAGTKGMLTRSA